MLKRSLFHIVIVAVMGEAFMLSTAFAAQFQPPQTARMKTTINQNWKFTRSDVSGAQAKTFNDAAWSTVHLPHNFENVSVKGQASYYRGIGWYRKHFTLDASYAGKQIAVYFEGAMTVASVYINGTALSIHRGGFTPFCYDVTQYCLIGGDDNVLAVKLDNTYQSQVPPEKPDGSGIDFCMFGGIYRDVWLIATDKVFIPEAVHDWANNWTNQGGHFITTPTVSTGSASVVVRSWVKNATTSGVSCYAVSIITDATNEVVQTNTSTTQPVSAGTVSRFTQTVIVASPKLWYQWNPYRYTVHTVVYNGSTPVDYYATKIGIRQIQFTKTAGAFINGTSFKILGLNRHQIWPFVGHAVPNIQQRRDAAQLKDASCNFVRCSHYLQDDAFLDACDSLGILVWEEIPGWHCCNNDGKIETDATWRARHFDALKATVRSARNHPSIAIWGPGINEAISDPTLERPLNDTCHQEDSTRMTSIARAGWQHPVGAGANIYDIYGDNQFTPGSVPTSNPDPNCYGYLNTEHTGHTYPVSRGDSTEEKLLYQAWLHATMMAEGRTRGTWVLGSFGWCMYDYYTEWNVGVTLPRFSIANHGVVDIMRIPKPGYYLYKSQSAADNFDGTVHPFMKIVNTYRSAAPVNRDVYNNCDSVRLYRNGTLVATQGPGTGLNIPHCPTTFFDVSFVSGMLTAEGFQDGRIVCRDTARTPGTAMRVRLVADPPVIEANGGDFSRVEAWVIDANGTTVPYSKNQITFSIVSGGSLADLIGDNPVAAQNAACINLVKARLSPGVITIQGSAAGLTSGTTAVTINDLAVSMKNRIPVKMSITDNSPKIKKVGIGRVVLATAKPTSVHIYNCAGRLLRTVAFSKRSINVKTDLGLSEGVYIIKTESVVESHKR